MNLPIEQITAFFGWMTVLNTALLVLSTIALIAMRGFISKTHGKLFGIAPEALNTLYFNYLGHYKITIVVFNLVPYMALRLI